MFLVRHVGGNNYAFCSPGWVTGWIDECTPGCESIARSSWLTLALIPHTVTHSLKYTPDTLPHTPPIIYHSAEGRYLSASRDLAVPPVLDSRATRASPAAHWRVTGQGITNVAHPHKVRVWCCSVCVLLVCNLCG